MKIKLNQPIFPGIKLLDLLIEVTYLAIIFLIPLFFAYFLPTFNIFELNKIILFKILTLILFFLVSLKLIVSEPIKLSRIFKKYFLFPLIFLFGLIISFGFSGNYLVSFFGDYNRQQGLLSHIYYFSFFVLLVLGFLAINNVSGENKIISYQAKVKRLIYGAVFSSLLVSIYGILQILGIDFFSWPESPLLSGRIISSFGQPNFLASFLLLAIPLAFYLFIDCKRFIFRFLYLLIIVLEIICLLLTSSRGAIIALAIAAIGFLLYLLLFSELKKRSKAVLLVIVPVFLAGIFIGLELFMPGRVLNMADYRSGSFATRLDFFSAAADAIKERPIFGYGLENESNIFIKYYSKDWAINGDVGANTDRAHNLILDILLTSGLIGLASLMVLYFWFFSLLIKNIKNNRGKKLSLALFFGAFAYLLSLLVGFPVVGTEVYLWFFMALAVIINLSPEFSSINSLPDKQKSRYALKIFLIFISALFCFWQIINNFRLLKADYYFNQIYISLSEKEYGSALVLSEEINKLKINHSQQNYYNNFLGNNLSDTYSRIPELAEKKLIKYELERIYQTLGDNNYKEILLKAKISAVLGDQDSADKYFKLLELITPYWTNLHLERAIFFSEIGDFKSAKKAYLDTEASLPNLDNPLEQEHINSDHKTQINFFRHLVYKNLGNIFFQERDYKLAEYYYLKAYRSNFSDYTLFKKIADTYYLRGDLKTAILFNKRGMIRGPLDYNWSMALSELYREDGQDEQSKFYFDKTLQLAPADADLEEFKKLHQN